MNIIKGIVSLAAFLCLVSCIGKPIDEKVSDLYRRSWGSVYYTDKENSFLMYGNKIDGADAKTFIPLAETVGKDKNTVFYKTYPQPQIDNASFQVREDGSMCDKNHVFIPSFSDGDESKLKILYHVDLESYAYFKGHTSWGYDKDHVYYQYSKPVDVDRATFSFISDNFMKDKDFLYALNYDGLKKLQIPTDSIVSLSDRYLRDNHRIYLFDSEIANDFVAISFESVDNIKLLEDPYLIVDQKIYCKGSLLNNGDVDVSTFEVINDLYSKDAAHVFCVDHVIESADPATFQVLEEGASKDKHAVYFGGTKLTGVDPQSFRIINTIYFSDSQHVYCIRANFDRKDFFQIVDGADPASFYCDDRKGSSFGADKMNEYYNGRLVLKE